MIGLMRARARESQRLFGNARTVDPRVGTEVSLDRYYGLDAMRAATMFLVVALHSALAYAQVRIPNLIWAVHDRASHPAFDVICWWAMGISSPFFLMSGFFAADVYRARGPAAFFKSRFKRIVLPFFVAGLCILPATFFVWTFGWRISGECSMSEIRRMKFHLPELQRNLYGPAHLWSLEYLSVMLFGYWLLQGFDQRLDHSISRRISGALGSGRLLLSRWRPLLLAVPTTLVLWAGQERAGLDPMLERQNSFVLEPFRLLHNALFFAVGVLLHRSRHELARLIPFGGAYLALSVPVFACRVWLIRRHLAEPLGGTASLCLAATGALFAWLTTFALLSLAQRFANRPLGAVRYLADSSYWIYLVHLPIVGLVQVGLALIPVPAALKFLLVVATALGLGLSSYQLLVRYTAVGAWLHGRRHI